MKNYLLPLLLLVAWLTLGSTCERTVDPPIELPGPKLVVTSSFTLGETVKVGVSKSQNILDNSPPEYLADANVQLFQGENLLEDLQLKVNAASPRIPPFYETVNFKPAAATTYTIKVAALGFEPVIAHSFIPESVPFTALGVSGLEEVPAAEAYQKAYRYRVHLNFDDPPGEENFYHLNLFQEILEYTQNDGDTIVVDKRRERLAIEDQDPTIVSDVVIGGLLLRDNPRANGYAFDVEVAVVPEFEILGQIYAELRTVSEEYYQFYATYSRQQGQTDGPFKDPVVIFNNIENGQGIFAGYNLTQDSIRLSF